MKQSARKKRENAKLADMRRSVASVELSRIAEALQRVESTPSFVKELQLQLLNNGVVMRFEKKRAGTRIARVLKQISESEKASANAAYLASVKDFYLAENVDTEQAVATVRRSASAAEKSFYSSIGSQKTQPH